MKTNGFSPLHILIGLVIFTIIVIAGLSVATRQSEQQSSTDEITNFDECVAAGNPIMESYPEQCAANGKTFVNEAQQAKIKAEEWLTKKFKQDGEVIASIKYPLNWEFKATYGQAQYKEDAFEILSDDEVTVYALLTTAPIAYDGSEKVFIHKKTLLESKYDGQKIAMYTVGENKKQVSRIVIANDNIGKQGQTVTSTELVFGITQSKGDAYFVIYSKYGNTMQDSMTLAEFDAKAGFKTAYEILQTLSFN